MAAVTRSVLALRRSIAADRRAPCRWASYVPSAKNDARSDAASRSSALASRASATSSRSSAAHNKLERVDCSSAPSRRGSNPTSLSEKVFLAAARRRAVERAALSAAMLAVHHTEGDRKLRCKSVPGSDAVDVAGATRSSLSALRTCQRPIGADLRHPSYKVSCDRSLPIPPRARSGPNVGACPTVTGRSR